MSETVEGEQKFAKCFCAWCQNPIEFPTDHFGELAPCPHCGKNTPLRLPGAGFAKWELKEKKRRRQYLLKGATAVAVLVGLILIVPVVVFVIGPGFPNAMGGIVFAIILVPAFALIYFLPAIVGRKKRNAQAILVLNIFAGWMVIGWIVALVWASTKDPGGK